MTHEQPRILGVGYAVPSNLRTNDDPIFDWLNDWLKAPRGEQSLP